MGLEKLGLEVIEQGLEHIRIARLSDEILESMRTVVKNFEDFVFPNASPWKDATKTVMKNGNELTIGKAGAKCIENKTGELLVYRKCLGEGPTLADGTPTLRFMTERPSGRTYFYAKPNLNGSLSPVRL